MNSMTIGKAAREAGVGVETIRFYERKGLIEQPRKPGASGFRSYPEKTIKRVRFIRRAQDLGFSLREVAELLALRADPCASPDDVRARAAGKLEDVRERIDRLQRMERALETLIDACPGRGPLAGCSIMDALEIEAFDAGSGPWHGTRDRRWA